MILQGFLGDTLVTAHTCDPEPAPLTPEWIACIRAFSQQLAADVAAGEFPEDTRNDKLVLKAWRGERLLAQHTCRPAPDVDTPEWTECLRAFVEKLEAAQRAT